MMRLVWCWVLLALSMPLQVAANESSPHRCQKRSTILAELEKCQFDSALRKSESFIDSCPSCVEPYFCFCLTLKKCNQLPRGRAFFQQRLRQNPQDAFSLYSMSLISMWEARHEDSYTYVQRAIRLNSDEEQFFNLFTTVSEVLNRDAATLDFLFALRKEHPRNGFIAEAISTLYAMKSELDHYIRWSKLAEDLEPTIRERSMRRFNELFYAERMDEAIKEGERLTHVFEDLGDLDDLADISLSLSLIYRSMNKSDIAQKYLRKAATTAHFIGDDELEKMAEEGMAEFCSDLGNTREALAHLDKVLQYATTTRREKMAADIHLKIAWELSGLSEYQQACDHFQESFRLAARQSEHFTEVESLLGLALLKSRFKAFSEAEQYLKQAGEIIRMVKEPIQECDLLMSLGQLKKESGAEHEALPIFRHSLEIAKKNKFNGYVAENCLHIAELLRKQGKVAEAREMLEESIRVYRKDQVQGGMARALLEQGIQEMEAGKLDQADASLAQASEMAYPFQSSPLFARIVHQRGKCAHRMGDAPRAERLLLGTLYRLERMEDNLRILEERTGFSDNTLVLYREILDLLGEQYSRTRSPQILEKAFLLSERAKSRNLTTDITHGRILDRLFSYDPELRSRYAILNRNIEQVQNRIARMDSSSSGSENLSLRAELNTLEKKRRTLIDSLKLQAPSLFRIMSQEIQPLSVFQAGIPSENAVLEYFVSEKDTYFWVISRDRANFGSLHLGEKQLSALLDQVSHNLYGVDPGRNRGASLLNRSWAAIRPEGLQEMCRKIFMPAYPYLSGIRRLVIVPHGRLHFLPFEMLILSSPSGQPTYLAERFTISYLPFAQMPGPEQGKSLCLPQNALLIGEPDFSRASSSKSRGQSMCLTALPYSGVEVKEIGGLLPHTVCYTGRNATEEALHAQAPLSRIIHISTHYILDPNRPSSSRLALTPGPNSDGNLYAHEILNMNLRSDLVVLSGCETGLGMFSQSEGQIGVSRAFLCVGASSVVATLWPVGDKSTSVFMGHFYRALRNGYTKDEALREAKLAMLKDPQFRDPYYWAAFVLIGDASPIPLRSSSNQMRWMLLVCSLFVMMSATTYIVWRTSKHKER